MVKFNLPSKWPRAWHGKPEKEIVSNLLNKLLDESTPFNFFETMIVASELQDYLPEEEKTHFELVKRVACSIHDCGMAATYISVLQHSSTVVDGDAAAKRSQRLQSTRIVREAIPEYDETAVDFLFQE